MNKVILLGRLTKDPDVRHTAGDLVVARFNIAVDRRYKTDNGPTADFPTCVAFGKTAEFIEKYFFKGMKISLEGRLQTGSYTNKEGVKKYITEVVAEAVEFAESKRTDETDDGDGFVDVDYNDEDLPFN